MLLRRWIKHEFEVLIFLGKDETYLPSGMIANIRKNYIYVGNRKQIRILVRFPKR